MDVMMNVLLFKVETQIRHGVAHHSSSDPVSIPEIHLFVIKGFQVSNLRPKQGKLT